MKRTKRSRNRGLTEKDIDMFCMSVEETLRKIHARCAPNEVTKRKKVKVKPVTTYSEYDEMEEVDDLYLVG